MTLQDSDKFQPMECPSKMVVRMECDELECGRRPANVHGMIGDSNEIEINEDDITAKHETGHGMYHYSKKAHMCVMEHLLTSNGLCQPSHVSRGNCYYQSNIKHTLLMF